ncbi:MAG TPA: Dabb family protein [Rhodocyclaceae bacterium]
MIVHLVLFKLKPGIAADDARLEAIVADMDALPRRIPLIRAWEFGANLTGDAQAWDYGLRAAFDNEGDLHAYFEHPAHLPLLQAWDEIASLAFVDFNT